MQKETETTNKCKTRRTNFIFPSLHSFTYNTIQKANPIHPFLSRVYPPMMSTENPKQASAKAASRKSSSAGPAKYQEPSLRCPRCDSPNTKFCYYNNYSLSQPRHFCKTCRRYWTKGGALRNVPIGGGCRKNKKLKCSPRDSSGGGEATDVGGLRFFQGISPAMDFQLNFPRLNSPPHPNHAIFGHFSALGDNNIQNIANPSSISTPGFTFDPTIGFPFSSSGFKQVEPNNVHEMGAVNFQRNFASSIESLSSINQDLHWKLQQQRLAMFASQDNEKESLNFSLPSIDPAVPVIQKPQPILFQNLEVSNSKEESCTRKDGGTSGSLSTEWFFDTSLATSSRNANENINNWSGIQAWTDFP